MSNGSRRTGQSRGKRDRNKPLPLVRVAVRFLVTICIFLSLSIWFNIHNNSLAILITVILGFLGVFGTFFISVFKWKEDANTETAFNEVVTAFLVNPVITVILGVLCASVLSAIFIPEPVNEGGITAQAPDNGAAFPIGTPLPDPHEECHITLSAWEIDPFFKKKDEYMGYQVIDDELSDVLFHQLSMTVLLIPVKGPYGANDLDFSPYGEKH